MTDPNVFVDLGIAADEATVEAWRSDFARIVRDRLKESGLSQSAFAKKMQTKQSIISQIVNGRVGNISVEFLLKLCVRLGTVGHAVWTSNGHGAAVTVGNVSTARADPYSSSPWILSQSLGEGEALSASIAVSDAKTDCGAAVVH